MYGIVSLFEGNEMLAKRIIGVVLVESGKVVRRVRQKTRAIIGNPEVTLQYLEDWNCDELMFINLSGDFEGTKDLLETATANCFIPLSIGGNIDTYDKARWCINNGAEKVIIGRAANERLCNQIADTCGRQAVCISIDHNHKERTKEAEKWAGEIILHDISRDGTGEGLNLFEDIELEVPRILMGGVGNYKHIIEGLKVADAVAVGNLFHYKELSATQAKNEAKKEGFLIR